MNTGTSIEFFSKLSIADLWEYVDVINEVLEEIEEAKNSG